MLIHAANGKIALEEIEKQDDFSLILMDIKMPVMNGIEASKIITKKKPGIPIVAQSAYISSEEMKVAMNAGCIDYIKKPIDANILRRTVIKYCVQAS